MSDSALKPFTYVYLRTLMEAMKRNFDMHLVSKVEPLLHLSSQRVLLLRHDVDLCLSKAVLIAEIEHDMGIGATYYIAVDSPLYSLKKGEQVRLVKRIMDLGHEIGLHHINASTGNGNGTSKRRGDDIRSARDRLEQSIGAPIGTISFHRPTRDIMDGPLTVEGMTSAYAKELTGSYISDSAGRWRDGDPLHRVRAGSDRLLQVLIHPIWWGEERMDPPDRLQEFFEARTRGMSPPEAEHFDDCLSETLGRVRRRGHQSVVDQKGSSLLSVGNVIW